MQLPTNPLKAKLTNPGICAGIWASFASTATVEALAHSSYDWMLIDMEHAPIDLALLHHQLAAATGGTCQPVVRPPWCDMVTVKRLMDLGVQSFMFPMIDTPEQARHAVSFTRYPPLGVRGIAGGTRATHYGRVTNYLATAHTQVCVVVQIESPSAVRHAQAICAVDGVDAAFIGPNDLAASMGYPGQLDHPDVQAAITEALAGIRAAGKAAGILATSVQDAQRYLARGATFIACGSDVRLLTQAADAMGTALKALV